MRLHSMMCMLAFVAAALFAASAAHAYDATSIYKPRQIESFTVLINSTLEEHPAARDAAIAEMTAQFKAINRVVPERPLTALRKVKFWLEWENNKGGAAEFHPSAQWLREHGYNPEKAGCVEISNAANFVKWSHNEQPWMLLHELAHAYHFLTLGEQYAGIPQAYQQAMTRKLYDSVAYVDGGMQKAYATTNDKEYFAELSEAYFGKNDFFPFIREELRLHDPVGYRLMQQTWGEPKAAPAPKPTTVSPEPRKRTGELP